MNGMNLGTLFSGSTTTVGYLAWVLVSVFALSGIWLVFSAATDLSESVRGRRRISGWAPVAKVIGAGFCYEIPQALGVVWGSVMSTSTAEQNLGAQASGTTAVTNCLSSTNTASTTFNPVACVFHNLATDCVPQLVTLMLVVAGVTAIFFYWRFIQAAIEKATYSDQQVRLPWGYAIVGTLFAGVGAVVEMCGGSVGFSTGVISSSGFSSSTTMISYLPGYENMSAQYQEMLAAAYAILAAVGVFEVIHGGYLMAGIMNGRSNASGGKCAAHIILGMILTVLPQFIAAIYYSAMGTSSIS